MKTTFPRTEDVDSPITEKINPHSRFTQSKNAHSRIMKKCRGPLEKEGVYAKAKFWHKLAPGTLLTFLPTY